VHVILAVMEEEIFLNYLSYPNCIEGVKLNEDKNVSTFNLCRVSVPTSQITLLLSVIDFQLFKLKEQTLTYILWVKCRAFCR